MIKLLLIAGIGSFFGGALRFALSTWMKSSLGTGFPWGTLSVNLIGCLIFGMIFALFHKYGSVSNPWCLFLTTGFCGGFTTFSTFANESMQMLQNGNTYGFVSYMCISLIAGIALIALGYWIVR